MGFPENVQFQLSLSRYSGGVRYEIFCPGTCLRGTIHSQGKIQNDSKQGQDLADSIMRSFGAGGIITRIRSIDLSPIERSQVTELLEWIGENRQSAGSITDDIAVR